MDLWNFVCNLFGGKHLGCPKDRRFFNQSGNNHEDELNMSILQSDIDDIDSNFRWKHHFSIFSNPLEMAKYFEYQMDNMLRNFIFESNSKADDMGTSLYMSPQSGNLRDAMLKSKNDQEHTKLDTDLDGKVTIDNFLNDWSGYNTPKMESLQPRLIGKFTRKEYIHKPDGTIETKQIITNFDGSQETIISQKIGDKMHTIVTKRDRNGIETKTEDFFNLNE